MPVKHDLGHPGCSDHITEQSAGKCQLTGQTGVSAPLADGTKYLRADAVAGAKLLDKGRRMTSLAVPL
jgi:hypothetical protein